MRTKIGLEFALAISVIAVAACRGDVTMIPGSLPQSVDRKALFPLAASCKTTRKPYSVTCTFDPNKVTISTSEGAPYGDVDFWIQPFVGNEKRYGYGPTKVMRLYICLSAMVPLTLCSLEPTPTGPLSKVMLHGIATAIASYRGSGIRVMPRFVYNFGPTGAPDAPLSIITKHLSQLAPILQANSDIIFGLEAGFFGTWGEWHDSNNGNLARSHVKTLLAKEVAYFGKKFPVIVRDPGLILLYTNGNLKPSSDLGMHDDSYADPADNEYTYCGSCVFNPLGIPSAKLKAYAEADFDPIGFCR